MREELVIRGQGSGGVRVKVGGERLAQLPKPLP